MRTMPQPHIWQFKILLFILLTGVLLTHYADSHAEADDERSTAIERVQKAVETVRFVAYTPTGLSILPERVEPASPESIRADLKILRRDFQGLVMYASTGGQEHIPKIAQEFGFKALILGIWDPLSETEINNALQLARAYPELVVGISVGNETLLAERNDWPALRDAMRRIRKDLPHTAITTSEPFFRYVSDTAAEFLAEQDFLLPIVHPLFEPWFKKAQTEQAVDFVVQVAARLKAASDKPILIKETGLPSGPSERGFSTANQTAFWLELARRLPATAQLNFVYFEAFDHAWKVQNALPEFGYMPEEAHWGLYQENRQAKPALQALQDHWHANTANAQTMLSASRSKQPSFQHRQGVSYR